MFTLRHSITILLFIIFSVGLRVDAQNNNKNDIPISDEHYEILEKRKSLIEQEVASNKDEWIGAYFNGDHHPTIFMWSHKEGFLTWGSNHTFHPSRINFGKVEFSNNRLIINPEIDNKHLNFQFIPTELAPVKWGEQHFLIPANELINFAYAVHSRSYSLIEVYFLKSADYQKSRNGLPNLPSEYSQFLKMKPIKPQVIAIKTNQDEPFWNTEITLNLGKKHRVIEGMFFYYANSNGGISVIVTEVQETTSKAKGYGIYSGNNDEPKLKKGLILTSIVPKNYMDFP